MSRLQAVGVGKLLGRGDGQGKPGAAAAAAAAVADSLSIRGTGHAAGRSPIHGSSPGYLAGGVGGGRNYSHTKGATGNNDGGRSAHHRGDGGSGGSGGVEASTSRYRPRINSNFGSVAVGDGVTGSRTTASVPAGAGKKREGGNRKSARTSNGGGSSNSSNSSKSNKAGDSGAAGGKKSNNGVVSDGGGGGGDDNKNDVGRAAATGGSLRPWTARQGQRKQHPLSPRLTGSGSGSGSRSGSVSGGSEPGNGVGGGGGSGGGRETGRAATTAASDGTGDLVKIHVCDESRGITRDFPCERELLLREMKYFQSYLVGASSPYDEIDILVHCDVRIFEWLFQYIHSSKGGETTTQRNAVGADTDENNRNDRSSGDTEGGSGGGGEARSAERERIDGADPPPLEVPLAVSILISSDFLQMQRLVDECLRFVGEHLTEIVKLPIDLSCLGDKMVLQLAKIMSLEQLAVAKDRKDKLLSRVHKKRIELDFRDRSPHSDNAIHCCRHCAGLFSEKVRDATTCRAAPPTVGFRGELVRRHEALSPWSLTRTVTSLHRRGMSWTAVYWFLWGLTQPLYCVECREVFLAGDIGNCHSHPQQEEACLPREAGGNQGELGLEGAGGGGYYPCCKKTVHRFALDPAPLGCVIQDHSFRDEDEDPRVLRALRLQRHNISYQDWRVAVREETAAAVKSVAAAGGGDGDGLSMRDGAGGGGLQGFSSSSNNALGEGDAGGGSGGGARDKGLAKRQPCAGSGSGSRRPPRGPDVPPAVVTTTSTTTTTTIDTVNSSPRASGSVNRKASSPPSSSSSPSVSPSIGKRPASAGIVGRRSAKNNGAGTGTGNGSGGGGSGVEGGRDGDNAAETTKEAEPAELPSEERKVGGAHERGGPEEPEPTAHEEIAAESVSPPTPETSVAVQLTPAAAGGPVGSSGDCRRIWEFHASERLSARERGLLPNKHPVQQAPLQQRCVNGDPFMTATSRDWSRTGDGQARRWQTDGLRESDGLRMAQMCNELRRKRRGAQQQQQGQ